MEPMGVRTVVSGCLVMASFALTRSRIVPVSFMLDVPSGVGDANKISGLQVEGIRMLGQCAICAKLL